MSDDQDYELIDEVLRGNRQAFSVLVERYGSLVFNLCFKVLRNREDAEEASQDTFLAAFRGLPRFRKGSRFSTWLFRISYNTSVSRLRKQKPAHVELPKHLPGKAGNSGLERMEKSGVTDTLQQALAQLGPDEAALLTLFYQEEMPIREIATVMSLTEANVKVKLHRSRQKLKEILSKTSVREDVL